MNLETSRLIIQPISKVDIRKIHELHSNEKIAEFNTLGVPINLAATEKLIVNVLSGNDREYGWIIYLKENNQFIGELGLGLSEALDRGEIHYSLHPDFWGQGLATEAVNRILAFGFENLKLQKIEANTASENTRSIKLLEQVGMTLESVQKMTLLIDDDWKDNYTYSISQPE